MTWYPERNTGNLQGDDGGYLDKGYIAHLQVTAALGTTTAILSSTALTEAAQSGVAPEAQPDCARILTITGAQAGQDGDVVITGTNSNNQPITETITSNGTATVVGTKAFKTITSIDLPGWTTDGNDEIAVGVGDKLGLFHALAHNTVLLTLLDDTVEGTAPTVTVDDDEVEKNVIDLNSALDGSVVDCYYIA